MKKGAHKTFIKFLLTKKHSIMDFIEPILFLPYAYGLTILPKGLDKTELIIWMFLAFIWAPLVYYLITRRHNQK